MRRLIGDLLRAAAERVDPDPPETPPVYLYSRERGALLVSRDRGATWDVVDALPTATIRGENEINVRDANRTWRPVGPVETGGGAWY